MYGERIRMIHLITLQNTYITTVLSVPILVYILNQSTTQHFTSATFLTRTICCIEISVDLILMTANMSANRQISGGYKQEPAMHPPQVKAGHYQKISEIPGFDIPVQYTCRKLDQLRSP
ncbi:unnamed protein product [Fusarium venenatum]|uniref:Uncharacterized protein n=1 Tax=Fusarium venenatum TaxID=56646 RepID=A0A2L2T0Q2_9HYPO|nr:uncharacterized protein FVRRES_05379 [Fusarium venenatum]CEI60943.1 unnamed protein product [Fusarium venenatum]